MSQHSQQKSKVTVLQHPLKSAVINELQRLTNYANACAICAHDVVVLILKSFPAVLPYVISWLSRDIISYSMVL